MGEWMADPSSSSFLFVCLFVCFGITSTEQNTFSISNHSRNQSFGEHSDIMKSSLWLWWIISFHVSGSGALASSFRPKPPSSSTSSSSRLKSPTTGAGTSPSSSSALPMTNNNEQTDTSPSSGSLGHPPEVPSLNQYRKFALPCLGLWIAGPLLSLVDTAFIGLSGAPSQSSQQLAALGPATTFCDGGKHYTGFLWIFPSFLTGGDL